jgi:hypothetical protein
MIAKSSRIQPSDTASAEAELFRLQVEQHFHDEAYHREIARLSLHQRLNHMALHFAKYAGKLAARPNEVCLDVWTDVLIIALSTANVLNLKLATEIKGTAHDDRTSLKSLASSLALLNGNVLGRPEEALRQFALAAGSMAGACEKIDHLEEVSYRKAVAAAIGKLAELALSTFGRFNKNPAELVRDRLSQIKQKLQLHGHI